MMGKNKISETEMVPADHRTQSRLIEAAGIVFAEKGYDRATGREICELARVNSAAVNYHFGGKERLYIEALREAHRRLVNFGALQGLVDDPGASVEKLEEFFVNLLHTLLDPSPTGWIHRIIMREMAAPTMAFNELAELQIRPTSRLFRSVIARLMDLPPDHEAVIRGTVSTVAQFVFIFQNRRVVELVNPELNLKAKGIDEMARHILRFTIAGLRAVALEAKQGEGA